MRIFARLEHTGGVSRQGATGKGIKIMYSTKVLGNSNATLNINHSNHKAALAQAVKDKKQLPHGAKKK